MTDMIGFAGLGNIGLAMASRLQSTAGPIRVWNRTTDKALTLAESGAVVAESPEELFDCCEVIGICVTSHVASGEIARRMFARASPVQSRRVLVDLSTGSPAAAADLAREAAERGVGWVDSPVSGGVIAAIEGRLALFVGGAAPDIDAAAPLLDALGARKTIAGGPGAGQTMKLCNQMMVAANIMAIAETLAAARLAGIAASALPQAFYNGFADSGPLRLLGPKMVARDYGPEFGTIRLFKKDLLLARETTSRTGAWTPILDLCIQLCDRAEDQSGDIASLAQLFYRSMKSAMTAPA